MLVGVGLRRRAREDGELELVLVGDGMVILLVYALGWAWLLRWVVGCHCGCVVEVDEVVGVLGQEEAEDCAGGLPWRTLW